MQNHSANFVAKPEVREDANRYKIPASILSDNGDDLNTAGDTARASEVQLDEVEPIQAKISASLPDIPGPVLPVSDTAGCVAASVAMAGDEVAGIGARLADGGGGLGAGEVVNAPAKAPSIALELPLVQPIEDEADSEGGNFRFELEFFDRKSGVAVKIRERTRFTVDGKRPSFVLGVFAIGKISKKHLTALKNKTLPPGVKAALAEGDISYGVLEQLFKRPGKGATAEARKAGKEFRQAQAQHNG